MTSKLTREQLHERARENVKALKMASRQTAFESAREEILADLQLAELALAAMDSEPVAYIDKQWTLVYYVPPMSMGLKIGDKLYRHAQQPVVPDNRAITQHFDTIALETAREILCDVNRRHEFLGGEVQLLSRVQCRIDEACRAAMLQENAKSAGESNNCRSNEKVQDLQAGNCREIAETSTGTAITPAAPDKKLTDDVLDEIIAGAKTSMEQYLALPLKAEREVWRKEGPTDDERIMAIEGIHNCERCGGEGWIVGEMGITRCACGQAGNSPAHSGLRPEQSGTSPAHAPSREHFISLCNEFWNWSEMDLVCSDDRGYELRMEWDGKVFKHPVTQALWRMYQAAPTGIQMFSDGYVMVPKEPTDEMIAAAMNCDDVLFNSDESFCVQFGNIYEAMIAAAPQEVQGE